MSLRGRGASTNGGMMQDVANGRWVYTAGAVALGGVLAAGATVFAGFVAPLAMIAGAAALPAVGIMAIAGHMEHARRRRNGLEA